METGVDSEALLSNARNYVIIGQLAHERPQLLPSTSSRRIGADVYQCRRETVIVGTVLYSGTLRYSATAERHEINVFELYLSHVSSPSGGRLLNFKGSQLWNRLPKYLININSHQLFKKITVLLSI